MNDHTFFSLIFMQEIEIFELDLYDEPAQILRIFFSYWNGV